MIVSLSGDSAQSHVAKALAHAFRVEGLDFSSLMLKQSTDPLGTLVLQGQHFLFDLQKRASQKGLKKIKNVYTFTTIILLFLYPLFQKSSSYGHPLLQVFGLSLVLCVRVHLDFTLICVQQFQLLLQLHAQRSVLVLLSLIQSQLLGKTRGGASVEKQLVKAFSFVICGTW